MAVAAAIKHFPRYLASLSGYRPLLERRQPVIVAALLFCFDFAGAASRLNEKCTTSEMERRNGDEIQRKSASGSAR